MWSKIKCKPDHVYNTTSERCLPNDSVIGSILTKLESKSKNEGYFTRGCPPGTIKNPKTNNCVDLNSITGLAIRDNLEKRKKADERGLYCPDGKIFNESTQRCIDAFTPTGLRMTNGYTCDAFTQNVENYEFHPHDEQMKVVKWFEQSKRKRICIYHGLGSGKTCTCALCIDTWLKDNPEKKVFVFLPASLRQNFLSQYCRKCGQYSENINKHFVFISYNYTFVLDKIPSRYEMRGNMIVVEEIHNLISGMINGGKHYTTIYDTIKKSKADAIIGLSGTVISSSPLEIYYMVNLMKKKNPFGSVDEFITDYAVLSKDGIYEPRDGNLKDFSQKINGVYSYLPFVSTITNSTSAYPLVQKLNVYVPMVDKQYEKYLIARENEIRAASQRPSINMRQKNPKLYSERMKLYYIAIVMLKSRQLGNMYYPKKIDDIKLRKYSPKIAKLLSYVDKIPGKHVIYSEFKTKYGIRFIMDQMEKKGEYKSISFTGDDNDSTRNDILQRFNAVTNIRGEEIKCLLITKAGSEGLNLLQVRCLHILEQSVSGTTQVEGRVIRFNSHSLLNENERDVKIINYYTCTPGEKISDNTLFQDIDTDRVSSDMLARVRCDKKSKSIELFRGLVHEQGLVPSTSAPPNE